MSGTELSLLPRIISRNARCKKVNLNASQGQAFLSDTRERWGSTGSEAGNGGIMFDILLKDGLIIDPVQGIHCKGYVGIREGTICEVGENPPHVDAKRVFYMRGKIVTPGLIDAHCHQTPDFGRAVSLLTRWV